MRMVLPFDGLPVFKSTLFCFHRYISAQPHIIFTVRFPRVRTFVFRKKTVNVMLNTEIGV